MSKATIHMMQQLERTVDYVRKEFDASYAEIVGCLQLKLFEMCEECIDNPNDEEDIYG